MKKKYSLKTKIIIIMLVFMVSVVGLIYIFQTAFLDDFYRANKINNMEKFAHTISKHLDSEDLKEVLYDQNLNDGACLRIVSNSVDIIGYNEDNACALGALNDYQIDSLYQQIKNNDNKKLFEDVILSPYQSKNDNIYIYGETSIVNNEPAMVLVSSNIRPLQATTQTIGDQFKLITLIVVLASIGLALAISKLILKPIKQIQNEANNLPAGKYDDTKVKATSKEITDLNITLKHANEDINKADKVKKELIGNVSHDLRTPLTMIVGYGEMIRDLPEENNEDNINVIIDEAKRLSTLVDDLLDVSKMSSGKIELVTSQISLNKLLKDVYKQYVTYCKNRKISFKLVLLDDIKVEVDEHRIKQVLYNFLNNALNYNDAKKKKIILGVEKLTDKYRVYVYDNGSGIDEKDLANVWDRYYKVDREHKRASLGSGIGLSLSKELLEAHGLNYGVESKKNEYSKFYFDIKELD